MKLHIRNLFFFFIVGILWGPFSSFGLNSYTTIQDLNYPFPIVSWNALDEVEKKEESSFEKKISYKNNKQLKKDPPKINQAQVAVRTKKKAITTPKKLNNVRIIHDNSKLVMRKRLNEISQKDEQLRFSSLNSDLDLIVKLTKDSKLELNTITTVDDKAKTKTTEVDYINLREGKTIGLENKYFEKSFSEQDEKIKITQLDEVSWISHVDDFQMKNGLALKLLFEKKKDNLKIAQVVEDQDIKVENSNIKQDEQLRESDELVFFEYPKNIDSNQHSGLVENKENDILASEETISDTIGTIQSSQNKINRPTVELADEAHIKESTLIPDKADAKEAELVFYDYNKNQATDKSEKVVNTHALPDTLATPAPKKKIVGNQNEVNPRGVNNGEKLAGQNNIIAGVSGGILNPSIPRVPSSITGPSVADEVLQGILGGNEDQRQNTYLVIAAKEVNLGIGIQGQIHSVEFWPFYSNQQMIKNDTDGLIRSVVKLKNERTLIGGTLINKDSVRTNINLELLKNHDESYQIPLISAVSMASFLNQNNLRGIGGHILIELTDQLDQVDVESPYEQKIFLNGNFQVVKEEENYHFVLYIGVRPGNTVLSFTNMRNEVLRKVINIVENEILYDLNDNRFRRDEGTLYQYKLYEETPLGNKIVDLELIPRTNIKVFSAPNSKTVAEAGNIYTTSGLDRRSIFNHYFQFSHTKDSIFVGTNWKEKIILPSNDYIVYIFDTFGISSLHHQCLVQLNLDNEIKDLEINGSAASNININVKFLDRDGKFSDEASSLSKRIFILGDQQGLFYGRIEYADGKEGFFRSICSLDTYIIEQF